MSTPDEIRLEAEKEFPYAIKEVSDIWPKTAEMLKALVDHQREAYITGRMKSEEEINRLKEMLNSAYRELTNKR